VAGSEHCSVLPNIACFNSIFAVVAHTKAAVSQTLCPVPLHSLDGHKLSVTAKPAARSRHIRFASCPESQSILQDFTKPTEPQNILKAAQIPIHVSLGRPLIIPGHVACMTEMYILFGKCRRRCSDDVKSVTLWTGFVGSGYFSAQTSLRHVHPLQNSVIRLPTIRLTN